MLRAPYDMVTHHPTVGDKSNERLATTISGHFDPEWRSLEFQYNVAGIRLIFNRLSPCKEIQSLAVHLVHFSHKHREVVPMDVPAIEALPSQLVQSPVNAGPNRNGMARLPNDQDFL